MGSTKSVHALDLDSGPTASGPIYCPSHTIITCIQWASFSPKQVFQLSVSAQWSSTSSSQLILWVPHLGLDPFVDSITYPSFRLELGSVICCGSLHLLPTVSWKRVLASMRLCTVGWLSFALYLVSSYEWVRTIFIFPGPGYLTQDFFFLVPYICL